MVVILGYRIYEDIGDVPVDLTGRVAIKLHMGELGNPNHIQPDEVGKIADKIRENGGEPFLADTTTLYKKGRFTKRGYEELAKRHGFGRFEVVIASDDEWKDVDGIRIAKPIAEADALLLLSHVTGHILTGLGAAIKNLAMGCVVKESKRRIHSHMRPVYDENLCTGCGSCVHACPNGCLRFGRKVILDTRDCPACGRCIAACTTGAMRMAPKAEIHGFRAFALAARAVAGQFRNGNMLCVNSLNKVTERCDCSSNSPRVSKDMGYICGSDPLSIDLETARLLREAKARIKWKTWDKFSRISQAVFSQHST